MELIGTFYNVRADVVLRVRWRTRSEQLIVTRVLSLSLFQSEYTKGSRLVNARREKGDLDVSSASESQSWIWFQLFF